MDASNIHREISVNLQDSCTSLEHSRFMGIMASHLVDKLTFLLHNSHDHIMTNLLKHMHMARLFYGILHLDDVAVGAAAKYARTCLHFDSYLEQAMKFLKKVGL